MHARRGRLIRSRSLFLFSKTFYSGNQVLEMGKGFLGTLLPPAPPRCTPLVGAFQALLFLGLAPGRAGRGVLVGAQKLPTSYGAGGAPPSPCTCNEWHPSNDTRPAVPAQACVASRLPCVASRLPEDGLLSQTKGLQHTDPEPPLPGQKRRLPAPPEEGEAAASCSVPKL